MVYESGKTLLSPTASLTVMRPQVKNFESSGWRAEIRIGYVSRKVLTYRCYPPVRVGVSLHQTEALTASGHTKPVRLFHRGCVVRRRWQLPWLWSEARVSAWAPKEKPASIFELTMTYGDFHLVKYKTVLDTQNVQTYRYEGSGKQEAIPSSAHTISGERWVDFMYTVDTANSLTYVSGNVDRTLVNFTTPGRRFPASLEVVGNNLTLNCYSGVRVWNVTREAEVIPLDGSETYLFSVFSNHHFLPSFTLGKNTFTLTRNQTGITTKEANETLPAFVDHSFTIAFAEGARSMVSCDIRLGENQTSDRVLYMNELPTHLSVMGRPGDKFYVVLRPTKSDENAPPGPPPENTTAVVLGVMLVTVVISGLFFVLYKKWRPARKAKAPEKRATEELVERATEEMEALLPNCDLRSSSFAFEESGLATPLLPSMMQGPALRQVVEGDIRQVKQAFADVEPEESLYVEAHLRAKMEIAEFFQSRKEALRSLDVVPRVLQELNGRLEKIFLAAKKGLYKTGVDVLLRYYGLPGSVTDAEGRSLLHYVTSCKGPGDAPIWSAENVLKLIDDHNCLPNAVDYQGRTCLHLLAHSASNSRSKVQWHGRKETVETAWLSLAKILVKAGGDPSLKDLSGELPHVVAKEKAKLELHDFFSTTCQQVRDSQSFKTILDAIKRKETTSVKALLLSGPPPEPLDTTDDLLTEAVKRGLLEVTTMLLSSGVPLCSHPLVSITPLEIAHSVSGIPAILPALLRREYANKLRFETTKILGHDQESSRLQSHMREFACELESKGKDASWHFTEEENIRKYLCIAAGLGLTLTCQVLGLDDVFLQPLLDEDKPVKKAVENKHNHMLSVLYRDLNMSLFSATDETTLPKDVIDNVIHCELKKLNRFLEKAGVDGRMDRQFQMTKEENGLGESTWLQGIAKLGLVTIYHKVVKIGRAPDINHAVEQLTGYNLLHLAALYGQLNMVEYLLLNKANVMAKGKNGFTAAHLAALRGNRECMRYLHAHMETQGHSKDTRTHAGLTAMQLADGYKALVEDYSKILLPEKDRLSVLSCPYAIKKTKILLQRKGLHLGITDEQSFHDTVKRTMFRQPQSSDIVNEMANLLKVVCQEDPRFCGEMVIPNPEGTLPSIVPEDSFQVYWQVNIEACTRVNPEHSGAEQCLLTFSPEGEFRNCCFRDEFHKAIRKSLSTYTFTSKYMWLTYPCISKADIGTSVYLVWYNAGKVRLIRVLLIPVLKTTYPKDNQNEHVSKLLDRYLKNEVPVHIANKGRDRWSYVLVQLESEILAQITEEQRCVLLACKLLTNLLYSCWWFPRQHSRRHGRAWGNYVAGIVALSQSLLSSMFFDELSCTTLEDWGPSKFLERIISIYKRATCADNGRPRVEEIPFFLDSRHSRERASLVILSVIEYLQELRGCDRSGNRTASIASTSLSNKY
ncbi:uncharacterized protein LOC134781222 [Penaeus indicus]|uniref:uncharacterized protein LOC134781222 n=1 Tax=Penaeus indicus TaxID=29960 RepID=UPI00300C5F80